MASVILHVDFGTRTTARHLAAAASDATLHPAIAPLVAKLPAETRARIRHIISRASAEGLTTAQAARQVADLGIESRAAMAIARTGLAVISDCSKPY